MNGHYEHADAADGSSDNRAQYCVTDDLWNGELGVPSQLRVASASSVPDDEYVDESSTLSEIDLGLPDAYERHSSPYLDPHSMDSVQTQDTTFHHGWLQCPDSHPADHSLPNLHPTTSASYNPVPGSILFGQEPYSQDAHDQSGPGLTAMLDMNMFGPPPFTQMPSEFPPGEQSPPSSSTSERCLAFTSSTRYR